MISKTISNNYNINIYVYIDIKLKVEETTQIQGGFRRI